MRPLARVLQQARKQRGWTLRQVESATGISNGYLSLLEHGRIASPSPNHLLALSDCYRVPYSELMVLAGYAPVETNRSVYARTAADSGATATTSDAFAGVFASRAEDEDDSDDILPSIIQELRDLAGQELVQVKAFVTGLKAGRRSGATSQPHANHAAK